MADFSLFLPILLANEGGWSDNPHDPGGATNMGIAYRTFQSCAQRLLALAPTIAALRALTPSEAGIIYRALYWNPIRGDEFTCQDLANIVCDDAVNRGLSSAGKLLQSVINQLSLGSHIPEDGIVRWGTLEALESLNQPRVYALYRQQRIESYQQIAARNPASAVFLKGWLDRVGRFPETASC